jgi:Tol biopolymer transport system component
MKFRTCFLLLVIIGLLNTASACSKPAGSQNSPPVTSIIFTSDRDKQPAFYQMSLDGQDVKKLDFSKIPPGIVMDQPIWSGLLNKFLFSATQNGQADIFSTNKDGSDLQNLTNSPSLYEGTPILSPDGKYIANVSVEFGPQIALMDADGKNSKILAPFSGENGNIRWSPDSQRVYFTSNRYGTPNIFYVNVDGSGLTNVSKGNGLDATYSFSPDGKKIVFDSDRDGNMDIFIMDANGGTATNISKNPAKEDEPLWSPDGNHIAFRSDRDGAWDLYVMNPDGSAPINLTKQYNLNPTTVVWLPDSSGLLVTAQTNNQSEIFRLPLDGSQPVNLTNNPANDYGPELTQYPN